MSYEYWACDKCGRYYPVEVGHYTVTIQQRTERIWGTETTHRPIETLIICPTCKVEMDAWKKQ